ncbi:MAG: hypothetical protein WC091_12670 [Sulfuricellaceae bacterium]
MLHILASGQLSFLGSTVSSINNKRKLGEQVRGQAVRLSGMPCTRKTAHSSPFN